MRNLELENFNKSLNMENNKNILDEQENILTGILNNVINWVIDTGLKYILPDFIENDVIKIKNDILNGNVLKKIKETIENVIILGKEKLNNEKKQILNKDDIRNILKNSDTVKLISSTIKDIFDSKSIENVNIPSNKLGNKFIEKNVEENLNNQLEEQIKSINKIESYKNEWYGYYEKRDLKKMNKVYEKINREIKNILPIENIIKEIRKIENFNQLIASKGGDFNLTKEEIELANKLV